MGSGFSRKRVLKSLRWEGKCLRRRAKPAHFGRHLPIDDEDHGHVCANPGLQVVALDWSRKGLFAVLFDVARPRLRLHFDNAAGRFKSLAVGLLHHNLDFAIDADET